MTEATWSGLAQSNIDWRMSAAIENVPRGRTDLAEVTSLERAVRAWLTLDATHRNAAMLTTEYGVFVDGALATEFGAEAIARLAEHLPGRDRSGGVELVDDVG